MCFRCIVRGLPPRLNWRKRLERAVYPLQQGIRWRSREMYQEKRSCRDLRRLSDYYRRLGWSGWLCLIALFSFMGDEFARSFWHPRDFSGVHYESGLSLGWAVVVSRLTHGTNKSASPCSPASARWLLDHPSYPSHPSQQAIPRAERKPPHNHL